MAHLCLVPPPPSYSHAVISCCWLLRVRIGSGASVVVALLLEQSKIIPRCASHSWVSSLGSSFWEFRVTKAYIGEVIVAFQSESAFENEFAKRFCSAVSSIAFLAHTSI